MRRALAFQTVGCVLLAFGLAPFQHVHTHDGQGVEVHAHFYSLVPHFEEGDDDGPGPHFDHPDDHASVKQIDSFTLEAAQAHPPLVLTRIQSVEIALVAVSKPYEAVEACAHDPPAAGPSIPRAPPA